MNRTRLQFKYKDTIHYYDVSTNISLEKVFIQYSYCIGISLDRLSFFYNNIQIFDDTPVFSFSNNNITIRVYMDE